MAKWFSFNVKTSNPATFFRRTARVSTLPKFAEMQKGTLYYARGNHPCADIFFKDDTGALYLVDVGGSSNMSKALNKVHKMNGVLVKVCVRTCSPAAKHFEYQTGK